MNISLNKIEKYLRMLKNPAVFKNFFDDTIDSRIHETLAIYIFNNYGIETFQNLDIEGKQNALKSSGILFVENSYNYIQFKRDDISNNFFNVEATIVFNNQRRNLFFGRDNFKTYTFSQNSWITTDNNIFRYIRYNDDIQCDNLYKIIENETNKTSYLVFIDTNYDGNIDIETFVEARINHGFNLLQTMLGTHGINKLSMSFTLMESNEHDIIALPIFVNTVNQFLLNCESTNSIMLIVQDDSFLNYFDENQNYNFE
jgi:hypothetical protein